MWDCYKRLMTNKHLQERAVDTWFIMCTHDVLIWYTLLTIVMFKVYPLGEIRLSTYIVIKVQWTISTESLYNGPGKIERLVINWKIFIIRNDVYRCWTTDNYWSYTISFPTTTSPCQICVVFNTVQLKGTAIWVFSRVNIYNADHLLG